MPRYDDNMALLGYCVADELRRMWAAVGHNMQSDVIERYLLIKLLLCLFVCVNASMALHINTYTLSNTFTCRFDSIIGSAALRIGHYEGSSAAFQRCIHSHFLGCIHVISP